MSVSYNMRDSVVIDDVVRLGIINENQMAEPDRYMQVGERKVQFEGSQTVLRSHYSFSQYGVSFMNAVTAKNDSLTEGRDEHRK